MGANEWAALGAGLGNAFNAQAERMDLDRRAEQEFQRKKDLYKYQLDQEEMAARAALAQGGSEREREMLRRGGQEHDESTRYRYDVQRMERENELKQEAEANGWKVEYNTPGDPSSGINPYTSGPEVQKRWWDMQAEEHAASLNRPNPKTGKAQESYNSPFGKQRQTTPTTKKPPRQKPVIKPTETTQSNVPSLSGINNIVPAPNLAPVEVTPGSAPPPIIPPGYVPEPVPIVKPRDTMGTFGSGRII